MTKHIVRTKIGTDYLGRTVCLTSQSNWYFSYADGNTKTINYYYVPSSVPTTTQFSWPVPSSEQVTLRFGQIDELYNAIHYGVDIQGVSGCDVVSAVNGIVVFSGNQGDYGNVVIINTAYNGMQMQTRYSHLLRDRLKKTFGDEGVDVWQCEFYG